MKIWKGHDMCSRIWVYSRFRNKISHMKLYKDIGLRNSRELTHTGQNPALIYKHTDKHTDLFLHNDGIGSPIQIASGVNNLS